MFIKKLIAIISSAVILTASGICTAAATSGSTTTQPAMRDISTMELVRDMGVGINLGNTMESYGDWISQWGKGSGATRYETAWGSPVITQEMIMGYANEGFGVLRIPVSWSNMMSSDYTISDAYLARVRQIADWALDCNMYVILNIHYDGGWINNYKESGMSFSKTYDECMTKYTRIWEQLSEAFKDYDDYLMFESLNEEGCWSDIWSGYGTKGKEKAYALLNDINQTFVDTVRASGGNNAKRHLLIAGYATDVEKTCDPLFVMPTDPVNRCAVSVHYYTPSTFAILEEDASWGTNRTTWGTDDDIAELNKYMDMLETTFINNGIPVIIGEYGCPTNNKDADSVRLFLTSVCEAAYTRQICPILWDITDLHYSRTECKLKDTQLRDAFLAIQGKTYTGIKYTTSATEATTAASLSLGDVNNDGAVNALDASAVLTAYANIATGKASGLSAAQTKAADANSDSSTDALDASLILSYYAYTATGGKLNFTSYLKQ
jgi:endoglucanase